MKNLYKKLGILSLSLLILSSCRDCNLERKTFASQSNELNQQSKYSKIEKMHFDEFGIFKVHSQKNYSPIKIDGKYKGYPLHLQITGGNLARESSYSVTTADLDGDGDLDIILANGSGEIFILENKIPKK